MAGFEGNSLAGVLGGLGSAAMGNPLGLLSGLAGVAGLFGGGGKGVQVSTTTSQAVSQQLGVSISPVINVSSPGASNMPESGPIPLEGSPISLSTPTYQTQADSPNSLPSSLYLPSSNTGVASIPSNDGNGVLDFSSPIMWLLLGLGAYLLYKQV